MHLSELRELRNRNANYRIGFHADFFPHSHGKRREILIKIICDKLLGWQLLSLSLVTDFHPKVGVMLCCRTGDWDCQCYFRTVYNRCSTCGYWHSWCGLLNVTADWPQRSNLSKWWTALRFFLSWFKKNYSAMENIRFSWSLDVIPHVQYVLSPSFLQSLF